MLMLLMTCPLYGERRWPIMGCTILVSFCLFFFTNNSNTTGLKGLKIPKVAVTHSGEIK